MLSFHRLSLSDRETVRRYTETNPISFCQFTNMYMWREVMHYRICEEDGILYLIDRYRDGPTRAFFPFCAENRRAEAIERLREAIPGRLTVRPVNAETADWLCARYAGAEREVRRSEWDYLYRSADLIALSGKKYHAKKNHLNTFCFTYRWEYHDIRPDSTEAEKELLLSAARRLYVRGESRELDEEYTANCDLMAHLTEFSLRGAVLTVDGVPVAYSVGEQITPDMALIHIEKADREIRGAYAAINRMFVSYAWSDLTWINREEDMGIEGLRRAKESYHPAAMNEVYAVHLP